MDLKTQLIEQDLICRAVLQYDLEAIGKLNEQQDFKITDIDNCIVDRIVQQDEKVIAYGIVKHFAEAIILVNTEVPKISRAKALIRLMAHAIKGCRNASIPQLHCFVKDVGIAEMLKKHYGFQEVKDIVLVKNI